jgi:hypothetical protein
VLVKSRDRTSYSFFCVKSVLDNSIISVYFVYVQYLVDYSYLKSLYKRSKVSENLCIFYPHNLRGMCVYGSVKPRRL